MQHNICNGTAVRKAINSHPENLFFWHTCLWSEWVPRNRCKKSCVHLLVTEGHCCRTLLASCFCLGPTHLDSQSPRQTGPRSLHDFTSTACASTDQQAKAIYYKHNLIQARSCFNILHYFINTPSVATHPYCQPLFIHFSGSMHTLKLYWELCEYQHFPGDGAIVLIRFTKEPMTLAI